MKVESVEAIPFSIPFDKPVRFASGQVEVADHVLVRVRTSDGVTGVAEAPPRPYTYGETQTSIVAAVQTLFAPAVVGLPLLAREQVRARVGRTVGNPTAKAALDMALWDAWARPAASRCTSCSAASPTPSRSATWSASTAPPPWSPRPNGCATPTASRRSR